MQCKRQAYLLLNEQFQTIQKQAILEAIIEESPVQTKTLSEITPCDLTQEIYPSLQEFNNQVTESVRSNLELADSALQISLERFLTEDQDTHTRPSSITK